ncbi:MAG TPA: serine/threonine-protein kinase [Vicinamibacterales bacterium]|nr:serine/threonine-protein kinase [Vicinamibacterales bacterium]
MIGKTIGHYEIVEQLGAGGMGVVYRARDTRLNRSVAFKVLSAQFATDPDRRRRFLQEARSAGAVNHPAIAQIYDADEADGVAYITMEFVEGRTVRSLIANRELDLLAALEVGTQVAEGLQKAHDARIVHRDIKSDNIMVTPDGHAKILDFGLAKPMEPESSAGDADADAMITRTMEATQAGMVVGTIGYMSPEQARGRALDHRSDLFSLGVVLYEMVTGEMPFRGESPLDTLHAIAFEETRPVTALRSHLPPGLQRVIAKCLRKQPEDRYTSASLLAKDLRAVTHEIDSGISETMPLAERVREAAAFLGVTTPGPWLIPAVLAVMLVLGLVSVIVTDNNALAPLIFVSGAGLLVYRRARNRRPRLMAAFAKRAAKMPEVQLITLQDPQVVVVVTNPLAKTYVHLNAAMDRTNAKLFFGDRFTLSIRHDLPDEDVRNLLARPGVLFARD